MSPNPKAVGLLVGACHANTREICRSLTNAGLSSIVLEKESQHTEPNEASSHWSGQPGQDLFFNGWKLLF